MYKLTANCSTLWLARPQVAGKIIRMMRPLVTGVALDGNLTATMEKRKNKWRPTYFGSCQERSA